MADYPKEQLQELYKYLPEDLQKAFFSEEIGGQIKEICSKNEVKDEDTIFEITKNVGYVFLGLLSPNDFQSSLKKKLKLKNAEVVASEIINAVFLPLKSSLEKLYNTKIKAKKIVKKKKTDRYRETI